MKQRAITAVFFAAAMIGGIYGGQHIMALLFTIITIGSIWELMELLLPKDEPHTTFRKVAAVLLGVLPVVFFETALPSSTDYTFCGNTTAEEIASSQVQYQIETLAMVLVSLAVLTGLLLTIELFLSGKSPFAIIGSYLTGVFYISLPIVLLFSLARTSNAEYHPHRVFGLLWLVWTNDTFAYLIGSRIGKRKLFPRISPNKTWEGTIGGALCTVGMAWLLSAYFDDYSTTQWLALGVVVGVFGTLGDLVESMLKRSAGVKDSGKLLPGHGGLLDRFDAFLFVLPFAWLVVMLLA